MDYFNDVNTTFLGLARFSYCLWRVRKLSDFIKNILICVQKMNKGLSGLDRHEDDSLMTDLSSLVELPLVRRL